MNFSFFLICSCLVIFEVSAQYSVNGINKELQTPYKPIENGSRIVYPSEDTNMNRRPSHVSNNEGRKPIEDHRICYENELLYPGDNDGDWVCDCKPGYLHFPSNGVCYEAFTQGPCQVNQIIRLVKPSNVPECISNECGLGNVFYRDNCYPLHSDEGCKEYHNFIGRKVLLVPNPSTLELTCADEDFKYACLEDCCIGSKREYRKICRRNRKSIPAKSQRKETSV